MKTPEEIVKEVQEAYQERERVRLSVPLRDRVHAKLMNILEAPGTGGRDSALDDLLDEDIEYLIALMEKELR